MIEASEAAMALNGLAQLYKDATGRNGLITHATGKNGIITRVTRPRNRRRKQPMLLRNTQAPVSNNIVVPRRSPQFRTTKGKYVVGNREFLRDITGAADFSIIEILTQPGIAGSFPWLSQIANTHQKYKVVKLVFHYVPLAATSERGRITLAYSIDPLDPLPFSKQELFQYPTSCETSVWAENKLIVDVTKRNVILYTRSGAVQDTDIKTYDYGKLFVAASNTANGTDKIGELFVDYEVELMVPKPSRCPASNTLINVNSRKAFIFGLPGSITPLTGSNVVIVNEGSDLNFMRFLAPGEYLVKFRWVSTTIDAPQVDFTTLIGSADVVSNIAQGGVAEITILFSITSDSRFKFSLDDNVGVQSLEILTALSQPGQQLIEVPAVA